MLRIEQVAASYGNTPVLFGVNLEVPQNGLVCLMGHNGVGKTTLMNTIMGLLPTTAGTITFEGRDLTTLAPYERCRAGLGYVPQGRGGFPQLTVMDNLRVVMEASKISDRGAIDEALDLFPRLVPMLERRAGFLSGGQQQQLAMARALVTKPRILLLDEPTEGIQPSIILEIEDSIAELHASRGLSILLVEQYVEFAARLADHYAVMESGEISATGETASLSPESLRQLLAV
ncbi:MAG: urea ABC transporter ATP-binding subunit UrtE [Acidimicrobiales bacterium]